MSENEALHLLAGCYEIEVNRRNRSCVYDRFTLSHLMKMAKIVTRVSTKFGIMLGGTWGNGKTTMMYAFRRAVNHIYNSGGFRDVMPEYWKPEFEIIEAEDLEEIVKDRKEFRRLASLRMLGIDDLGAQKDKVFDYGNVLEPVKRLIELRYNRQLFTFITTNQTKKDIEEAYDERINSRLSEMFHRIGFSSEIDYRKMEVDVKSIKE